MQQSLRACLFNSNKDSQKKYHRPQTCVPLHENNITHLSHNQPFVVAAPKGLKSFPSMRFGNSKSVLPIPTAVL
eukprot:m.186816 g.186816  ORF g.186816 m.186816 type:complete len:74 (+) comp14762_c0_seq1:94-315(+)